MEFSDAWPVFKLSSTSPTGLASTIFTNTNVNATTHQGEFNMTYEYKQSDASKSLLRFGTYPGGEVLAMVANGNVGIGTTTPTQKLSVNGNQTISGNLELGVDGGISTISGPASSGAIQIKTNLTTGGASNRYLRLGWKDNNAVFNPALSINDDFNVGIGTTMPDARLTVRGTIHTQEVKVDLNVPGPDYVFESTYHLPTLEELNVYIKVNKHLPEVPSACAMEENGINLGEMNMILLKKVEELTLYMIEQQKVIKNQNERITKLENK